MEKHECGVIRDLLPLYADDVAEPETRKIVERHLSGCPECLRELEKMKKPVVVPAEDPGKLKRFVKHRDRRRVLTAVVLSVCICMLILTGYTFSGLARYQDVVCWTGFQCDDVSYTENPNGLPTWGLWLIPSKTPILIHQTFEYGDLEINGEQVPVEICFMIYETHWGQAEGTWCTGYDFPDDWVLPEDYDCTVRIVFKDQELVYSMREEGLFDPDTPHDPGCCFNCTKEK